MTDLHPTDAELALLRVLWHHGPSTVRQVHDVVSIERPVAYTTVLKMFQVMHDKGLVHRDTSRRSHVYTPAHAERAVQRSLVADLVDKAFGGSASRLVAAALGGQAAGAEELAEIRALLDALEQR